LLKKQHKNIYLQTLKDKRNEVKKIFTRVPSDFEDWFLISLTKEGKHKLSAESQLALKLVGLKTGDDLKFGNGFTIIEVDNN